MILTFLAIAMITIFIVVLAKKKLSIFGALTLIPLIFGIIATFVNKVPLTDMFEWIKTGLFYSVNAETGKVSMGVISPAIVILFVGTVLRRHAECRSVRSVVRILHQKSQR